MSKVIVVDDDHSTTALIEMLLRMEGHDVVCCDNTGAALVEASKGVSAFIVDHHLERGESGLDLIGAIRNAETEVRRDVPIIMVSGDERLQNTAEAVGADAFLIKPYSTTELVNKLNHLLITQRD